MARLKKQAAPVEFPDFLITPAYENAFLESEQLPENLQILKDRMLAQIIDQNEAVEEMVKLYNLYEAGLHPGDRPVASALLLGSTGCGKTKSVQAFADAVHGASTSMVRIDCGEFQMDHEVSKLLGAPPGYLGHRETQAILSQQHLTAATSDRSKLSIVLFDEIEKAAPALQRILLGILDHGQLKLGDNSKVNFNNSMVFFTSNLGLKELSRAYEAGMGLNAVPTISTSTANQSAQFAAKKHFSPEFWNRLDKVIVYNKLSPEGYREIFNLEIQKIQNRLFTAFGTRAFYFTVSDEVEEMILSEGVSDKYGARELKRAIDRLIVQPLATVCNWKKVEPGRVIKCVLEEGKVRFKR